MLYVAIAVLEVGCHTAKSFRSSSDDYFLQSYSLNSLVP